MYSSCPLLAIRHGAISLLLLALVFYDPRTFAENIQCHSAAGRVGIQFTDCSTAKYSLIRTLNSMETQRQFRVGIEDGFGLGTLYAPLIVQHGTCKITLDPNARFLQPSTILRTSFARELSRLLLHCISIQGFGGTYTHPFFFVHVTTSDIPITYSSGLYGLPMYPLSPQMSSTGTSGRRVSGLPDVRAAIHQVLQQSPDHPIFSQERTMADVVPPGHDLPAKLPSMPPRTMQLPIYPSSKGTTHQLSGLAQAADAESLSRPSESQWQTAPATGPNVPLALPQDPQASATGGGSYATSIMPPRPRKRKGSKSDLAYPPVPPRTRKRKGANPKQAAS